VGSTTTPAIVLVVVVVVVLDSVIAATIQRSQATNRFYLRGSQIEDDNDDYKDDWRKRDAFLPQFFCRSSLKTKGRIPP
jgi:hypothetical protein